MNAIRRTVFGVLLLVLTRAGDLHAQTAGSRIELRDGWHLNSSAVAKEDAAVIASHGFQPQGWYSVSVPTTVLNALTKHGVYPDMRIGMNAYQIPDSSDEFNVRYDLAKFSHLPDKRNPWRDPYWFRKPFTLPAQPADRRVWLHFDCINYRAEVWLNGHQVADSKTMVGMFQRFDLDITSAAKAGDNVLAVKIFPVDHPGVPDKQTEPMGKDRGYQKEIMKDVTMVMTSGYDCMPTVPDRNMGIIQDVWVDGTGPVAIRHPFIVTELPLPQTDRATLRISMELTNATGAAVKGIVRGNIAGTNVSFQQEVELAANQTKEVVIDAKPVLRNPKLWWPRGYGEQSLYDLNLSFDVGGSRSDQKTASFGVRQVSSEVHERNGWHGRRVLINGQKIFCRGGYIQPEILFDWDVKRIEAEMRYLAEANLNLIYFEDIPNPPDSLLEACDRLGIMFGQCHYACSWPKPNTDHPQDVDLLMRCTADLIKRYRNHPSLIMYMAQNEDDTRRDVYEPWRKLVIALDGTRWFIPSAYFPSNRKNVGEWFRQDLPTGMNDKGASYGWAEPVQYFNWVRESRNWMFMMESGSASVPPMSSYMKFMPEMQQREGRVHPDSVWAHHDGCHYIKPFDEAMTRLYDGAGNTAEYVWKAHLLAADQHRSMFEAVNHRMWDVTSGLTQWKITACWPSVEWQVFDWYLKPMVSWYYIKKAGEPLHVQLNLPDRTVSIINRQLTAQTDLQVRARMLDMTGKQLWEKTSTLNVPANAYAEAFTVPQPAGAAPVHFVKLELKDAQGRLLSDNFYWLRGDGTQDLKALATLPQVELKSSCVIENNGAEKIVRVTISNPGSQLAFFSQVALTKGPGGAEILPVLWDDNYFSLLPGETRQLKARFAASDKDIQPILEVGGWNVQSPCECTSLDFLAAPAKADQPIAVLATIANTFLDGGRVTLYVDDKPAVSEFAWARGESKAQVAFDLKLPAGKHTLRVGSRSVQIDVR